MRLLAAPLPHRVALPGRLDLYDLGAHVAEQLTAERSGEQRAGLDHAQVGQRAVLERCAAHAGPPSCADFSPRFAHGKKRGRCGGSSPVSALHRAFSSSMDSKPRLNSGLAPRSEEHTSELQSREKLVCRLLL